LPASEPPHDCPLCPRLAQFRAANRERFPDWWNAPVPSWGDPRPRLVIVGLAPGLKGANRTGRPFTGDYAGTLLFATLLKFGLATGVFEARPDDSLSLTGALIVNAVRCVPPQNKPLPTEIATCRQFLLGAIEAHPARVYLALGRIAHEALLTTLGQRPKQFPFAHGAEHLLPNGTMLFDSYHCSRQNTNTGRLTTAMFEDVVGRSANAARGQA
jgi:uracil-DNA glycosylase family 4